MRKYAAMGLTAALCAGSVMSASAEEKKVYKALLRLQRQ